MFPSQFYHVYNRGNHRQRVFVCEEDYLSFLEKWLRFIHPVAETWAYALPSNHFHSVVRIREETLVEEVGKAFTKFFNSFARVLQNRHGYSGALFKRPYQREILEDDDRLRWTVGYVLTNVTHHNPNEDYRLFKWSSYGAMISEKPTRIPRERIFRLYSGKEEMLEFLRNQAAYYGLMPDDDMT